MWMMLVSLLLLPRFIRLASTLSSSLPLWNILYFVRHITLWSNGLVARSRAYVHSVALSQRPIRMAMAIFIIWIYGIHFYNNNAVVNLENYHFHSDVCVCLIFNVHFSCSVYGCWCCCCCFILLLFANQYTIFSESSSPALLMQPHWQTECKQNANGAHKRNWKVEPFMHRSVCECSRQDFEQKWEEKTKEKE